MSAQGATLKTRAQLKRELDDALGDGEEQALLRDVEARLGRLHGRLRQLSEARAALVRNISVRERKLCDWKGKIPRSAAPSRAGAQRELRRVGQMACTRVGCFQSERHIVVEHAFRKALQGVERFSKLWLLVWAADTVRLGARCSGRGVQLWLVDVRACDHKRGVVTVDWIGFDGDGNELQHAVILDMKPYLCYCEAYTDKPKVASGDEGVAISGYASDGLDAANGVVRDL